MSTNETVDEAVDVLQRLGLTEYEARCFVGLARLSTGTARELSELTGVPRTRIYDAVRVLDAEGLVEIRHTSPQRFRAVSPSAAMETLRERHEARLTRLGSLLDSLGAADGREATLREVWSLTGRPAVDARTTASVGGATEEVLLLLGDDARPTDDLLAALAGLDRAVDVVVGSPADALRRRVAAAVPAATTFVPELAWLLDSDARDVGVERLLLVDRSTVLVSSVDPDTGTVRAIFGEGFRDGLAVVRLLASRGLDEDAPSSPDEDAPPSPDEDAPSSPDG